MGGQTQQKGKLVYQIERDEKYRCNQTTNQENDSLDEMNYSLRTHIEWSDNLAYEHCKDKKNENKNIQKYIKSITRCLMKQTFKGRFVA